MPSNPRVLISGASIAGPALAWWLARAGFHTTIVERHPRLRPGGNGVDIRAAAIKAVEQMGLATQIREHATDINELVFVNDQGDRTAGVAMSAFAADDDVEIMRGDLAEILYDATKNDVEYLFDDSISTMDEDAQGVTIAFESGETRRFDLVVGADGLHSNVRRLAGMDDAAHLRHLGLYFAIASIGRTFGRDRSVVLHNSPGKVAGVYRSGNHVDDTAFFAFRQPQLQSWSHRDLAAHQRMLRDVFGGEGWIVPTLVEQAIADENFYLDSVTQVHLPHWSSGRVVLLGDAAYCATLLSGSGAGLALEGAQLLGTALSDADGDHKVAFGQYEAKLRRTVSRSQKQVGASAAMLIPKNRTQIWLRNRFCGLLSLQNVLKRPERPRTDAQ